MTEDAMKEYEYLKVEREDKVTIITVNRPEVYNALHSPAHFEFAEVFDNFRDDPDQWIAILTGAGDKAFSAGNDLKYQAGGGTRDKPPSGFGGITTRYDLDKPLIAAVNGFAMGGGFELALACDLIIAAENAIFALPEPRVGLTAGAGGMHRLPRMISAKQALGMILTGRRVGAEEGQSMGFVNEVTPKGEALAAAKRWAAQIMECSPMSIRASKQSVYRGLDEKSLETAIATVYPARKALDESADFIEGPNAFAEKRPPKWSGG
ncbi:MAG: crotonobetainyl-CoA hydratase [Alphaproteobacteria bacterium]|jgi:enoyl-CoA hydratase/carnithine racemase